MSRAKKSQIEGNGTETKNSQEKTMSTNEKTETKSTAREFTTKVKGYDLTDLSVTEKEIKGSFTPATNYQDALTRVTAGKKEEEVTALLNNILESEAVSNAKREQLPNGFATRKLVMEAIKSYRMMPQFSSLVTLEKGDEGWKKQYDAQTALILEQIKNVPFIMDGIRAQAAEEIKKPSSGSDDSSDE